MKKTYIAPTVATYKLKVYSSLLETSLVGVSSSDYNNGEIKGRESGGDFWDENE